MLYQNSGFAVKDFNYFHVVVPKWEKIRAENHLQIFHSNLYLLLNNVHYFLLLFLKNAGISKSLSNPSDIGFSTDFEVL